MTIISFRKLNIDISFYNFKDSDNDLIHFKKSQHLLLVFSICYYCKLLQHGQKYFVFSFLFFRFFLSKIYYFEVN